MLLALLSLAPTLATEWQSPPEEVLDVLHAPDLPWVWTAPSGEHLLLADPVTYAPLADYAAGWYELAGKRVALEVNAAIVPRGILTQHRFRPGDKVEIVHAIGGG